MKKPVTAMILAAGMGKRLRPLTLERPKPLLTVGGEPMIDRVLRQLKDAGFSRVVINLHHLGDMIRESVGDGSKFGLRVLYSEERELLGTGGGIAHARDLIGNDTFLVMNGDAVMAPPLGDIWERHFKLGGVATLVLKDDPSIPGHGGVMVDGTGRVRRVAGRPEVEGEFRPMLFTGVQVIEPVFFDFVRQGEKASSTMDVYPEMIRRGLEIRYYEYDGIFLDIGTPERYREAMSIKF